MKLKPETLKRIKNNELLTIEQTRYIKYQKEQGKSYDEIEKELGIDKFESLIVGNE